MTFRKNLDIVRSMPDPESGSENGRKGETEGVAQRDALTEQIRRFMEKEHMAPKGSRILVGVSGGADSVCLLYVLQALAGEHEWKLAVAHINHGIRQEAGEDAEYVQRLCDGLGVPFFLKKASVERLAVKWGLSQEEAGRRVRYQAFSEAADRFGADRIAVAHNRNDRAETLLFHLFRGTGLTGMGSIRAVRGRIIRPLLDTGREEIEEWLRGRGLEWCTDWTNETDAYTRNRIRHHILSYAREEICAGADVHLAREAELLARTADYVERMAGEALKRCLAGAGQGIRRIHVEKFLQEEELLQTHMLLLIFRELTDGARDIGAEHVHSVQALFGKQGGRRVVLPCHLEAEKSFGEVLIRRTELSEPALPPAGVELTELVRTQREGSLRIPGVGLVEFALENGSGPDGDDFSQLIRQKTYTKWLDYDKIESLVIRTRRTGDYLAVNEALQRKSLKKYLIQEKIPVRERGRIPLLADGSHILWVVGHRISSAVRVGNTTRRVLRIHIEETLTE